MAHNLAVKRLTCFTAAIVGWLILYYKVELFIVLLIGIYFLYFHAYLCCQIICIAKLGRAT